MRGGELRILRSHIGCAFLRRVRLLQKFEVSKANKTVLAAEEPHVARALWVPVPQSPQSPQSPAWAGKGGGKKKGSPLWPTSSDALSISLSLQHPSSTSRPSRTYHATPTLDPTGRGEGPGLLMMR